MGNSYTILQLNVDVTTTTVAKLFRHMKTELWKLRKDLLETVENASFLWIQREDNAWLKNHEMFFKDQNEMLDAKTIQSVQVSRSIHHGGAPCWQEKL